MASNEREQAKAEALLRRREDAANAYQEENTMPDSAYPLEEVAKDSRGNALYAKDNEVGGRTYWSDEVGGGVYVWDTSLVSREMLELAIKIEGSREPKND